MYKVIRVSEGTKEEQIEGILNTYAEHGYVLDRIVYISNRAVFLFIFRVME